MKALPLSSKIALLKPDYDVYISSRGTDSQTVRIKSVKSLAKSVVLSFYEISDKEEASHYRDAVVYVNDDSDLKEGEYFVDQIIGLDVFTSSGDFVGAVSDIFETKSNDVYVITAGEKEYLIPAVKEFIKKIDLQEKKIILGDLKGLLD